MEAVAFSQSGQTVLIGVHDNAVMAWQANGDHAQFVMRHDAPVTSIAVSPDDTMALTGSYDKTARLWSLKTGQAIRRFDGHVDRVLGVAFSPDGKLAATAGADATVRLWEVSTGRQLRLYDGHIGSVNAVAFSPDGRHLVSGGRDGTTRVWDVASGEQLALMMSFYTGEWLVVTPERFFDVSSPAAMKYFDVVRGMDILSPTQIPDALHRPDLVREKLAGDPNGLVKAEAAKSILMK